MQYRNGLTLVWILCSALFVMASMGTAEAQNAGGDLLWDDQFDKGGGFNLANAIAVKGNIVSAAGSGQTGEGDDEWVVRAYDAR